MSTYTGPVCYQDGWHYAVVTDPATGYDVVGERLYLDDNGTYRVAVDGDESWSDRKHERYALLVPADGSPMVSVTPDEMTAVQKVLDDIRSTQ